MARATLLICILCSGIVHAVDKSGVSPNVVSLPSGPGSIEGLGAEYQPQLNTGTASYSIPLRLPSGVVGHTPALSLTYEGGNGNGPLGIGWSLSVPSIRRQCEKGIPRYHPNGIDNEEERESAEEDRFLDTVGEELLLTDKGYYYPEKQEQFIRWYRMEDHWLGRQPDGALLELGLTSAGRIQEGDRVFAWLLERETDTRGNVIEYIYGEYPGSENQKYLREIRYGPGSPPWNAFYTLVVTHEDRSDSFDDYRSGFLIRTGKRISQIDIALQGDSPEGHLLGDINSDEIQDALIRRYELRYETHPHWSLLSHVFQVGADGQSTLPPAVLEYAVGDPERVLSAGNAVLESKAEPIRVMDNPLVDLIDLNADGLPDILITEQSGGSHSAYLNYGIIHENERNYLQWSAPQEIDSQENGGRAWLLGLADEAVSLADMDGDGLADLLFNPMLDPNPRYYRNQGKLAWGPLEWMTVGDLIPPAPFGDDQVRILDINFDKHADIVKSLPDGYQIWYNQGKDSSGSARYSRMVLAEGAYDGARIIQFSQTGTQLADLNGDRIVDVAQIRPTSVIFCPSMGYGNFGEALVIPIPTDEGFGHDDGFTSLSSEPGGQIEHASLTDITGDGLADLVVERAVPGELWYWINLGNGSFTERHIITDLPLNFSSQSPSIRWADMNGNGTSDLVYADSGMDEGERLRILDLGLLINGSTHPNLLTRIENGIGKTIQIEYRSSTEYALEDMREGNPWKYPMPNPLNVISRVTLLDGLGNEYVTVLRYHDGYYDGLEKEFRGFGAAEQIEIGDESQPTLVTKYTFDTGVIEESLKGKPLHLVVQTEDGKVFHEEEYSLKTRRLFSVFPEPQDPMHPIGVTFPFVSRTVKVIREEPSGEAEPIYTEMEFAYDDYGNKVMEANYGRIQNGDRHFGEDERIVWTVYSASPSSEIWNLSVEVVTTDHSTPPKIAAHSQHYYDGPPFLGLPLGNLERGNLMRQRIWVGPPIPMNSPSVLENRESRFLSVMENDDHTLTLAVLDDNGNEIHQHEDHWINSIRNEFDPYGNIIITADPLAVIPDEVPDPQVGHYRKITYDPLLHTHPIEESIAVGNENYLSMWVEYDLAFGTITRSWDMNGFPTRYTYDTFARIHKIVKPGGDPPDSLDTPTVSYIYSLAEPVTLSDGGKGTINWIDTHHHEKYGDSEAYFIRRTFQDGLARTILIKEEDENPERVVVKDAKTFNRRKQPDRILQPFYSENGFAYEDLSAPDWNGTWVIEGEEYTFSLMDSSHLRIHYDATGREIVRYQPDNSFSQTIYKPLMIQSYDEEKSNPASKHFDTPIVHHLDGLGRLVQVDETARMNDEGETQDEIAVWPTRYQYDLLDNIIRVADSQDNIKTYIYDALSRRLSMNDPDRGTVYFSYDDISNLIESVDAKNQRITYTYDGVNRLLTEDYHDEEQPFSSNRRYDRSLPISESNRPDIAYFYDEPAGNLDLGNGKMGSARNTLGFLSYVKDLSGEEHTSYNERGKVEWEVKRIPDPQNGVLVSYKTEMLYDALDRLSMLIYPDGDRISYSYNPRTFLKSISGGPTANIIHRMEYVPSQQIGICEYGNQVMTNFAYDRRNRMQMFKTFQQSDRESVLVHYAYTHDAVSNITRIDDLRAERIIPGGDKRRNTQIFEYDDLYRLTRVQYSFALPEEIDSNDGHITYRYDRIGNLLSKTSDIEHLKNNRSITHLGALSYGGIEGAWRRQGKESQNPGPHALTAMDSGLDSRAFAYDANGNLSNINDFMCTWDFKDRLIALENDTLQVRHTFDYTNRRISKVVLNKASSENQVQAATAAIYVNKYYEIREHDQAVKYVFDDSTRVAQITGTLDSAAQRVQRLRLHKGWNLLSLVVNAPEAARKIGIGISPNIKSAYLWNDEKREFNPIQTDDSIAAGTVLWILAEEEEILAIQGQFQEPDRVQVPQGGHYRVLNGLNAFAIQQLRLPDSARFWVYDPLMASWLFQSAGDLSFLADAPDILRPGQPIYIHSDEDLQLMIHPLEERIQYYHQNHLGSTAILTDAQGAIREETAYYPFGYPRHKHIHQKGMLQTNYLFTQKELDQESGLMYCEARFYAAELGRYVNVDPLIGHADLKDYPNPQSMNLYAYAHGNPVKYIDPSGEEIIVAGDNTFRIQVRDALRRIDPSAHVDLRTGKVSTNKAMRFMLKSVGYSGNEKGMKLIKRMVENRNRITIKQRTTGSEDSAKADDPTNAENPRVGSGGTIQWHPTAVYPKTALLSKDYVIEEQDYPHFLALGHELIHGDHFQRGVTINSGSLLPYEGLDENEYHAIGEEIRTVGFGRQNDHDITEHDLAKESGVGLRTYYSSTPTE